MWQAVLNANVWRNEDRVQCSLCCHVGFNTHTCGAGNDTGVSDRDRIVGGALFRGLYGASENRKERAAWYRIDDNT